MGSGMKRLWANHTRQPERTQPFPNSLSGDRPPWECPGDLHSWACWQGSLASCDDRVHGLSQEEHERLHTGEERQKRWPHCPSPHCEILALGDPWATYPAKTVSRLGLHQDFQSDHNPPVPTVLQAFTTAKTVPQGLWVCLGGRALRKRSGSYIQPQDNTERERSVRGAKERLSLLMFE